MVAVLQPQMAKTGTLDQARKHTVLQADGTVKTFGDLLDLQNTSIRRTLVVFIRHFFCGNCQEYVRRLTTDLAPASLPSDLSIIIIGCGMPSLIPSYIELTGCPFPIYADPSTRLYSMLGMQRSLSLGPKGPSYIQHSLASGVVKSIVQGLRRIPSGDAMRAGELDVNGGEFIFERGCNAGSISGTQPEWHISWSHRMMNSRDHAEIEQIQVALSFSKIDGDSMLEPNRPKLATQESSGSLRRSMSLRRRSWMVKAGSVARSTSLRRSALQTT